MQFSLQKVKKEQERVETRGIGRQEKDLFNNRRDFSSFAG